MGEENRNRTYEDDNVLKCTEPLSVDAMYGGDGAAARWRDRRLRQFLRHEQVSVKMHVAAALHHSAQRGARVDAATQTEPAPALVVEYIAPAPAASTTLAPVNEYVVPALVVTDVESLLEPPVPVFQGLQVPQVQIIENIVEILETISGQDAQTSECLGTAPVCQMKPAETMDMV